LAGCLKRGYASSRHVVSLAGGGLISVTFWVDRAVVTLFDECNVPLVQIRHDFAIAIDILIGTCAA
jgi:hypothetical protein